MAPGLSGGETRGRGCDMRTDRTAICSASSEPNANGNILFLIFGKVFRAIGNCAIDFINEARNWLFKN
jgi:hypothetical protein